MAISSATPRTRREALATLISVPSGGGLELVFAGGLALYALLLSDPRKDHLGALPTILLGAVGTVLLFWVCGDALARLLVPSDWGAPARLLALPIGAASSALVLTALGVARLPFAVNLWVTVAAGVTASVIARRKRRARGLAREERRSLLCWAAVLLILFLVGCYPAWRTGLATVYGANPDSHQVVGIALLFQHVSPTGTDVALPIDTVPPAWRFRYPIFYPLSAVSYVSHLDPIRVFPAMAGVLLALCAFGFGVFAVRCLRAPRWAGPMIGAVVGVSALNLYLLWHPYWNQLWGIAMLPYAVMFGWVAIEQRDRGAGLLFALMLVMLDLAYPLALPYPLLFVAALALANWRSFRLPHGVRGRRWLILAIGALLLAPALIGAAVKLSQALHQLLSTHSALWGGDVTRLLPLGTFVGTGGGVVPALLVVGVAVPSLWFLPRRLAVAFGGALAALCLVDLRFRLVKGGAYMDFKHLSFVGAFVVTMAASTLARVAAGRSRSLAFGALSGALVWGAAIAYRDHREIITSGPQVTPQLFQIRDWAAKLPPGASVRVDVPPSGTQLWTVYMLGDHPVDTPRPVTMTTYAHARYGVRADYSISLRYDQAADPNVKRPVPAPPYTRNPPLFQNDQFVVRKIVWPSRLSYVPDTSSTRLVEP